MSHTEMNQTHTPGTYWRSLGQLENSEEFQQILSREFPEGITEAPDEVSRRGFLGAVAASVALAGMASCRKPETKILPFTKRPEGYKPGIAQHYATTISRGSWGGPGCRRAWSGDRRCSWRARPGRNRPG